VTGLSPETGNGILNPSESSTGVACADAGVRDLDGVWKGDGNANLRGVEPTSWAIFDISGACGRCGRSAKGIGTNGFEPRYFALNFGV
jgi:hypothetical protein